MRVRNRDAVCKHRRDGHEVLRCGDRSTGQADMLGSKERLCSFTLSQNVCVAVPVDFGATATVGGAYVECLGASAEDICTACDILPEVSPLADVKA